MTAADKQLSRDLRRLMEPADRRRLSQAQARGALPGERGYVEEAELEAAGGTCTPIQLTSSDGLFTIDIA